MSSDSYSAPQSYPNSVLKVDARKKKFFLLTSVINCNYKYLNSVKFSFNIDKNLILCTEGKILQKYTY